MKLFCLIVISLFVTACDFPKRGDQISYTSYNDAYEVASRECQNNPQFVNDGLADCLRKMDFQENIYAQDFESVASYESAE
jgi:hypothetical protein